MSLELSVYALTATMMTAGGLAWAVCSGVFVAGVICLPVLLGPFPTSDAPATLLTAFAGIAAMSIQSAVQRVHFASLPPSTIMTGNTTQAVLAAVDAT